jgi:hypothetical protein
MLSIWCKVFKIFLIVSNEKNSKLKNNNKLNIFKLNIILNLKKKKEKYEEITQSTDVDLFFLFEDMMYYNLIILIKILIEYFEKKKNKMIILSSILVVFLWFFLNYIIMSGVANIIVKKRLSNK